MLEGVVSHNTLPEAAVVAGVPPSLKPVNAEAVVVAVRVAPPTNGKINPITRRQHFRLVQIETNFRHFKVHLKQKTIAI